MGSREPLNLSVSVQKKILKWDVQVIHWHSGSCLADLSKFPFKIKLFSFIKRKKKKANLLRQQT